MNTYVCPSCGAALDLASLHGKGSDVCDFCGTTVITDKLSDNLFNEREQFRRKLLEYTENIAVKEAFLSNMKKKYGRKKAAKIFWGIAFGISTAASGLFALSLIVTLYPEILIFVVPCAALSVFTLLKLKKTKAFINEYEQAELYLAETKAVYQVKKSEYESSWILK